jgi:hypothetical protein
MSNKIAKLIIPVIMIIIGIQFTRDYFGSTTKERKNELIELREKGQTTTGTLDSVYKEQTIKVLGVPTKYYIYTYSFYMGGGSYSGKFDSNKQLLKLSCQVTYLKDDPGINSLDVEYELAKINEVSGSKTSLIIGLVLIIIGGASAFFTLKRKNTSSQQAV